MTGMAQLSAGPHPLETARAWVRSLAASELDAALAFYVPTAKVHVDGRTLSGEDVAGYFESSPLLGTERAPTVRTDDGVVVLRWEGIGDVPPTIEARCRIADGRIAEQWIREATTDGGMVMLRTSRGAIPLTVTTSGHVQDDVAPWAAERLSALLERVDDPVLVAWMTLHRALDPALPRPATVQVRLDVNGELVRVDVSAGTFREAIDQLEARLVDKLDHRASRRGARRKRPPTREEGEWRHGDPVTPRPRHFDRPIDEREIVRHKAFVPGDATPEEAAFDMDQLDYDFYLFRDLATGDDALLERDADGSTRLSFVHPAASSAALPGAAEPIPTLTVDDAVERLAVVDGERVFFANAATGRGNVVYFRDDGHYGLITLE